MANFRFGTLAAARISSATATAADDSSAAALVVSPTRRSVQCKPTGSAAKSPVSIAGLTRYGCIFFMLEKLGAVVGVSNPHIYAAMRGQTLEEFQATRSAPGALYSVAEKEGREKLQWDKT